MNINHHSTEIEAPNLKNLEGEAAMGNIEKRSYKGEEYYGQYDTGRRDI